MVGGGWWIVWWSGVMVEWRSGGVVEWRSGGVVECRSGGVIWGRAQRTDEGVGGVDRATNVGVKVSVRLYVGTRVNLLATVRVKGRARGDLSAKLEALSGG